jgi:copper transport protein
MKTLFSPYIKTTPAILVLLILLALFPVNAQAHAQILRSNPAANSSFESGKPPAQVQIWFTETVEPNFSTIEVYDRDGKRVDLNDTKFFAADPTTMVVSLQPALPDGPYTVSYRNVSREDGHPVKGSFSFVVGAGPLPASAESLLDGVGQNETQEVSPWSVVFRWLNYVAMSALVGSTIFLLLVWRPATTTVRTKTGPEIEEANRRVEARVSNLILWSLAGLAIGWLLFITYQATVAGNRYPWQIFNDNLLFNLLLNSRFGNLWLVRLDIILVAFLVWAFSRGGNTRLPRLPGVKTSSLTPDSEPPITGRQATLADPPPSTSTIHEWALWVLLVLGCGIMLTHAMVSHAAANKLAVFLIPVDLLHLIATGFWVGGLFCLGLALPVGVKALVPGTGDRTRLLAALIPNFSILAILSVAFLLISGVVQAAVHLGTVDAFFSGGYGLSLFIKLCLAAPLLALGAYNLLVVSPRMRRFARLKGEEDGAGSLAAGKLQQNFRRTLLVEGTLALILLGAVGSLTSFGPPAQDSPYRDDLYTSRGETQGVQYILAISPFKVGENIFEVELKQNGQPLPNTETVVLRFEHKDMDMGLQELELKQLSARPGRYSAVGSTLSMEGKWTLLLIVRRVGADEIRITLPLDAKWG